MPTVLRWSGPALLAAAMLLAADLLGARAVLFPEAVALAYGLWALRRETWARPVPLVAVPTTGAAVGILAAGAPGPWWWRTAAALAVMVLLLHVVRSPLIPALSAAVLPVVFDIRGVEYVLAVAVWCALLAATVLRVRVPRTPAWPGERLLAFVLAAAGWIVVVGLLALPPLLTAPPLLVAGLEFAARGATPLSWSAARRVLLVTAAGVIGATAAIGDPTWLLGGLGVGLVMALAALLHEPLTPAVALVLVPFVAGVADPLLVGGSFALGGLVLTVVPAALVRTGRPRRGRPAGG